jgi:hypothetical protein
LEGLLQLHTPHDSTVRARMRHGEVDRRLRHIWVVLRELDQTTFLFGFGLRSDGFVTGIITKSAGFQ